MLYLNYKLHAAGVPTPRTIAVHATAGDLWRDVCEELRAMFPDAVIRDERADSRETSDLLVWIVDMSPRALPRETRRAIQRRAWQTVLIMDVRARVAEVVRRERWWRWRWAVRAERLLVPILHRVVKARHA